jgi:hypothetical protein
MRIKLIDLVLVILVVVTSRQGFVNTELYTSLFQMQNLIQTSFNITNEIGDYLKKNHLTNLDTEG